MPVVLTDAYKSKTFFVPLTLDKSEGFWAKPLTESDMAELRREAVKEAAGDEDIAAALMVRKIIIAKVTDWQGYLDASGQELPCTAEVKAEICACDPVHAADMALRIRNIARMGQKDDTKN